MKDNLKNLPDYLINIEDKHNFNLEIPKDAIDFLILILNKENLYISNVEGIIFHTLGITLDKYVERSREKAFLGIAIRDIASFFSIFFTGNEFDNSFYNYLIENDSVSDLIKKQKINRLLDGIEKYIDYLWQMELVSSIDYHYKKSLNSVNKKENNTENIHDILKADNMLFYSAPSYAVYINLKGVYDYVWNDFSSFIDKESQQFSYFYSNKEYPNSDSSNKENIVLSRDVIFNYLFSSPKAQEIFEKYELALIDNLFLNQDKNKWLKNPVDFIRFYNYCEKKKLFDEKHEGYSTGVKLLRQLFNFIEGTDLDTPSKRKIQENKRNKHQFIFLNKETNFK